MDEVWRYALPRRVMRRVRACHWLDPSQGVASVAISHSTTAKENMSEALEWRPSVSTSGAIQRGEWMPATLATATEATVARDSPKSPTLTRQWRSTSRLGDLRSRCSTAGRQPWR